MPTRKERIKSLDRHTPPSVELGGPGWRFYLWQTRKRDRRLGRTSSMTCTLVPDPCSQNRAVKAPMSARAVTAAQLNTGHHLSKRVPCHPVWPRPVACSQGTSTVLCGDDLKSKLGSLPPQPIFRTADGVSFRLVKDALVVGLLCAQQVVNDSG